ncbi:hypothetical protein RclHR1_02610024 [Rhizophagus clarus]|uniref:Uncharacterized protein n=1 Tax=Rhizophagus clarus TaxID=94130 RepID=A0A2Z6R028_9GLOM|nr:hypothetical protein RclHR1_02610024 [Rhizophagus clarus]GES81192.1 hypothetical protein RCL_jg18027.t1 [Rhizophagus clarus]
MRASSNADSATVTFNWYQQKIGITNFLLHNLPEQDKEGLTDYDSLKKVQSPHFWCILEENLQSVTELLFWKPPVAENSQTLCHNYGLY